MKRVEGAGFSIVKEKGADPTFSSFYSPDLEGFTGIGHSLEDCIYEARLGMQEHVALLVERGLPVPRESADPTVVVRNQQPELAPS